jgi:hypothetical protein
MIISGMVQLPIIRPIPLKEGAAVRLVGQVQVVPGEMILEVLIQEEVTVVLINPSIIINKKGCNSAAFLIS